MNKKEDAQIQNDKSHGIKGLEAINIRFGFEESARDQTSYDWFVSIIAPEFAFQRADSKKTINNRCDFLRIVEPLKYDDPKSVSRETKVESIEIYGDQAVVECVVTFDGGAGEDAYVFGSGAPFNSLDVGVSVIKNLTSGVDEICLSAATFGAITAADITIVVNDTQSALSSGIITYSAATGDLFFNSNGATGGFGTSGQLASITGAPTLAASDFVITL